MTDAYQALDSLRAMLDKQREELKERIANGLEKDDDYRVNVGKCKALKDVIGKIGEQIRNISGGIDDDEAKRPK